MNESSNLINDARIAWKEGDAERAIGMLSHDSLKENAETHFLMGEIHYNKQNWGAALNSFRRCLQINPEQKAAQTYVDLILNILGFFHTDQFNP